MEQEKTEPTPPKKEPGKVESRLGPLLTLALKAYMRERHLTNESEIVRSALGQLLEREGYLIRIGEEPGDYQVVEKPAQEQQHPSKIGFRPDDLKSQPLVLGLTKLAKRSQSAASAHDGTESE